MHLYKEYEEEQVGGEITEGKNFTGGEWKNWWKKETNEQKLKIL